MLCFGETISGGVRVCRVFGSGAFEDWFEECVTKLARAP
jgi:hypothetical protein